MRKNPREQALYCLHRIEEKGAYANLLLDEEMRLNQWSGADRALLTELVNGTVRMKKHLDWVLNLFLSRKIEKQNAWLRDILRLGAYQLLFLGRIPDYAVVDEAVRLTREKLNHSMSRLVNAVLRNLARNRGQILYPDSYREPITYLAVYYSHPEWIVERWMKRYGFEKTRSLLEYNNRSPQITIRTNHLKTDRSTLVNSLAKDGCECQISGLTPWGVRISRLAKPLRSLQAFQQGWFYVQNEASMLVAPALSPDQSQLIYDLAAGVGGKTSHLAELVGNCGIIRAAELHAAKLEVLQGNTRRMGIDIVQTWAGDILGVIPDSWEPGDRVLLDAPCSGLGVLRRRADSRWRKTPGDIEQLTNLQLGMLTRAADLVRPGGILVYSTCTLEPEENEQVVKAFLVEHSEFTPESLSDPLAFFPFAGEDEIQASTGMLTLFPPRYGIDGMFIARIRRKLPK